MTEKMVLQVPLDPLVPMDLKELLGNQDMLVPQVLTELLEKQAFPEETVKMDVQGLKDHPGFQDHKDFKESLV